jgi:Fic family protein
LPGGLKKCWELKVFHRIEQGFVFLEMEKTSQPMHILSDILNDIEKLRSEITALGPLSDAVLRRLEYRFRLECNYFSNRQEGGTVMIGVITVENKPLRDIQEMKGHDEVMQDILRIGQNQNRISEKRIKEIHRSIIVEDNPGKKDQVGNWKTTYNEIINSKGEEFGFLPPDEVPYAMHDLLNWLNAEWDKIEHKNKAALHPAVLAFEFHHRFLTIHPFYDGNGRTARLLSNLILTAHGYPPFFINDEEKDTYNLYLSEIQGYGAAPDLFIEFMCKLLQRSLELSLKVIEGLDEDFYQVTSHE